MPPCVCVRASVCESKRVVVVSCSVRSCNRFWLFYTFSLTRSLVRLLFHQNHTAAKYSAHDWKLNDMVHMQHARWMISFICLRNNFRVCGKCASLDECYVIIWVCTCVHNLYNFWTGNEWVYEYVMCVCKPEPESVHVPVPVSVSVCELVFLYTVQYLCCHFYCHIEYIAMESL